MRYIDTMVGLIDCSQLSYYDAKSHLNERAILDARIWWDFCFLIVRKGFCLAFPKKPQDNSRDTWKVYIMPKSTESSKSSKASLGEWNGFVTVPFNANDKKAFEKWVATGEPLAMLHDLVSTDYKVTLNYDSRHDCFMCSISCYNAEDPNFKYTMTSRAPTPYDAMCVGLYKHVVLCEGVWDEYKPSEMWS